MSLEEKLLETYYLDEVKITALRKYINLIGMDWTKLNRKQYMKIARTQAYKQFKSIGKIKKVEDEHLKEAKKEKIAPKIYQPSKYHKHLDPSHISKKEKLVSLINKGYSPSPRVSRSLSGSPKHTGFRQPKKYRIHFTKKTQFHGTKTFSFYLPKRSVIKGVSAKYKPIAEEKELNKEIDPQISKVDKVIKKYKEIKNKNAENNRQTDFEIKKTMTGASKEANVIEIDPSLEISNISSE